MSAPVSNDTRRLSIDTDGIRQWDTGIVQRFCEAQKVPLNGLEPGPPGACDARLATIYGSVLREGRMFRMWYGVMPDAQSYDENPDHFYTAYAESDDAIHWRKPDLRITAQERFPANNLLTLPGVVMGVVPALPKTGAKYLAAVISSGTEAGISDGCGYKIASPGTYTFVSDDGLRWRQFSDGSVAQQGDVACLVVDPPQQGYLLYQKVGLMHGLDMRRSFIAMTSRDGRTFDGYDGMGAWRESFVADDYDDLQSMQAGFRIADHYGLAVYRAGATYVAVETIFQIGDPLRRAFVQNPGGLAIFRLAYSHNAINWRRPKGRPTWMTCGAPGEFDAGFLVPSNTFLEHGDDLLLYYGGSRFDHGWCINEDFSLKRDVPLEAQRDSARIGLARIKRDRFASLAATYKGIFDVDAGRREGVELLVNAACPRGNIRCAVFESGSTSPLPGFSLDDCIGFEGDSVRAPIRFRNARVEQISAAKRLMLRFDLRCAEIFGFEWGNAAGVTG